MDGLVLWDLCCCESLLHWYQKMDTQRIRIGLFVLALPGVFMLYETGDHGARTGIWLRSRNRTAARNSKKRHRSPQTALQEGRSTFTVSDNGNWCWEIGPNGVSTLLSQFRWLEGTASESAASGC
ncbi:MAG: hypothetical protein U5K69_28350 [Balneolaceae bacterium]|nr:hypothetical protein [Balneolaceae bacterium]